MSNTFDWRSKLKSLGNNAAGGQGPGQGGPLRPAFKKTFGKWPISLGLGLLALWIGFKQVTMYIPPYMHGIRQVYFGSKAGIRSEVLDPGLVFVIPGFERIHLFANDLEIINFSDRSSELARGQRSAPAVKIQTSDGYSVHLDVSVIYHIKDPYRVIVEAGPGRLYEDRLVIPRADRILRKTLGELNSEEFYQGPKRIEKSTNAEEQLAEELAGLGIAIDAVLVRRYVYDERYQSLIEGRKIKDQTVFLRQAEAKAAIEERKRDTAIAEGKANEDVEIARGDAEVKKIEAQAELYKRKKLAEGQLLIDLAEAKGTAMENAALQGAGSENMVGLKMADVLKGVETLVLASGGKDGINPLDVSDLLKKFEVK